MRPVTGIAVLVATATLAACGTEGGEAGPAAVVDGFEISQQAVVDELEAVQGNELYIEAFEGQGQPVLGTEPGTFDSAFVNVVLGLQVQYQLVLNEFAARGLEGDEACREEARELAVTRLAERSPEGDGEAVFTAFPEGYQETLVDREVAVLALQADLVGTECGDADAVRAYFEENRDRFEVETACVSHILVGSVEEANEIRFQLAGGADFAQTAAERSIDPAAQAPEGEQGAGGDLGCITRSSGIVPEFIDAAFAQPVGEVGEPVQTQFGFHLLLVRSRGIPEFEDIEADVEAAFAQEVGQAFQTFFQEKAAAAEITIDPRYGCWNGTTGQIDRPGSVPGCGTPSSSSTTPGAPQG